jgi:hypothetical protein
MSNPEPIELDITVRDEASEPLDKIAAKTDNLEHSTATVPVDTAGVPETTDELSGLEAMKKHLAESPAVLDIQTNFDEARGDLEHAEKQLDNVRESAGSAKGEIAGLAAQAVSQVPGIDNATSQMISSFGAVAESASALGPAGVAAGTVAALAMYGIQKGADQAAERTDNLTTSFENLAKASDAAFTKQSQQVWADAVLRSALDGKKLTDQFKDLAETAPAVARRMLDNADAIGLNANAQKILTDALAANAAETAQAKETTEKYGDASADAAGKQNTLAASTAAAAGAAAAAKGTVADYVQVLNSVPPDKRTEFLAAVNRGDVAAADAILDSVASPRTAVINVAVHGANIGAQIGAMVRGAAAAAGGQVVSITNVNLPAGARGIDALREITGATRRVGSRYGSAAVSRARR